MLFSSHELETVERVVSHVVILHRGKVVALVLGLFLSTMPATTLSGFGTPISSMPPLFQKLSYVNPLRHIVALLRSVYLKGVGFDVLWREIAPMAVFAVLLLGISVWRFRKSLE